MAENKALVIGINDYNGYAENLNGCERDVATMAGLLKAHGDEGESPNFDVWTREAVECEYKLKKGALTADALRDAINQLFYVGQGKMALFYFSGHGFYDEKQKKSGLVTPDGNVVYVSEILAAANATATQFRNRVIILDCCYAGAVCGTRFDGGDAPQVASGVTLMAACNKKEYARETSGGGVFTSLLAEGLQGAAADLMGDVTTSGLYAFVERALGGWDQRPAFAANVFERAVLRKTKPPIELRILKEGIRAFGNDDTIQLNPSFEFTNNPKYYEEHPPKKPYTDDKFVPVFKKLQRMESVGLVAPEEGEEHMYFVAMNGLKCKLTAVGRYFQYLVNMGRI